MDEPKPSEQTAKVPSVPYATVVAYETEVRNSLDFWRLRTISSVLRHGKLQIDKFIKRYPDLPLN